jgi:hypothetical protein
MAYSAVVEVERIAQELVREYRLASIAEFSLEDIEYIASEAQVGVADVVDILGAELI